MHFSPLLHPPLWELFYRSCFWHSIFNIESTSEFVKKFVIITFSNIFICCLEQINQAFELQTFQHHRRWLCSSLCCRHSTRFGSFNTSIIWQSISNRLHGNWAIKPFTQSRKNSQRALSLSFAFINNSEMNNQQISQRKKLYIVYGDIIKRIKISRKFEFARSFLSFSPSVFN